MKLINYIKKLQKTEVKKIIDCRMNWFNAMNKKSGKEWFSELCFCILTANSKADTALKIQEELGCKGFCTYSDDEIKKCIIKNKHRFHNNKTRFILLARDFSDIKKILLSLKKNGLDRRVWLVKNIKGLGWKEASHFLRNIGFFEYAILDRHILRVMQEGGLIKEIPKILNEKKYKEIEDVFNKFAKKTKISPGELDLYFWFMKTGKVRK